MTDTPVYITRRARQLCFDLGIDESNPHFHTVVMALSATVSDAVEHGMSDTQAPGGAETADEFVDAAYEYDWLHDRAKLTHLIRERDAQIRAQALAKLRDEIRSLLVEAVGQVGCLCPEGTDTSDGYHQSDFCNAICAIERALNEPGARP